MLNMVINELIMTDKKNKCVLYKNINGIDFTSWVIILVSNNYETVKTTVDT